jgi:hypothetical protein
MSTEQNPSSPPLVSSYFNELILAKPETLAYRGSPVSPTLGYSAGTAAQQVTLTWSNVNPEDEASALAAWFVNMVRHDIGPDNAAALQQIIQDHWNDAFGNFFQAVANYRRSPNPPESAS